MRAVERYLPGLDQRLQIEQVNLFTGLIGAKPKDLLLFEGQNGESGSLSNYVERINSSEEISPFTLEYCFKNPRGWVAGDWGNFYLDAPRGLLLAWENPVDNGQESSFVVAGTSFSVIGSDSIEPSRYPGLDLGYLEKGDVLVAQIQAQKGLTKKGLLELKRLKWERTLLQMVVDWARGAGLPRVLVVPSANNYWLTDSHCQQIKNELKERLFLRYDVTARRCGFKQEADNLPYSLELPGRILYETF
jgi:hypothetical protein